MDGATDRTTPPDGLASWWGHWLRGDPHQGIDEQLRIEKAAPGPWRREVLNTTTDPLYTAAMPRRTNPDTPHARLWTAVLNGQVEAARQALTDGALPNLRRGTKGLLARALEQPTSEIAHLLLAAGADPAGVAHGTFPWCLAVQAGFSDLVKPMHEAGLDWRAAHCNGQTAVEMAARGLHLDTLRELDRLGALELQPWSGGHTSTATVLVWLDQEKTAAARGHMALWWEGLDWILTRPATDDDRGAVADWLSIHLIGQAADHKALVFERLLAAGWVTSDFLRVLYNALLYQGHTERAETLRASHCVPLDVSPLTHRGPWTGSPLFTLLYKSKGETNRPRLLKRRAAHIERLLADGADPSATLFGWPTVFWAVDQGVPWPALQALFRHGVDPQQRLAIDEPSEEAAARDSRLRLRSHSSYWAGTTLAHISAHNGTTGLLQGLLKIAPALLHAKDVQGFTPLWRAILPPAIDVGGYRPRIWPTLALLFDAGADPRAVMPGSESAIPATIVQRHCQAEVPNGGSIAHALAIAHYYGVVPKDIEEVLLGMTNRWPNWLDHRDSQGQSGWEVLGSQASFWASPVFQALKSRRRMERQWPEATSAPRQPGLRF